MTTSIRVADEPRWSTTNSSRFLFLRLKRSWITLWVFSWLLATAGCRGETDLVLTDFRLVAPTSKSETPVRLPGHFHHLLSSSPQEFSLVADVALPEALTGRDLEFGVACGSALWNLSVDGESMPIVLHDDLLEKYRANGPRAFRIPAHRTNRPSLKVQMDIHHTWTQSAWFDCPPILTLSPPGLKCARVVHLLNNAFAWMSVITLCVLATYLLMLWLGNKKMRYAGLFSVQLAGVLPMPAHILGLLQPLFGPQDTAVMGLSLSCALVVSVYSTNLQFGLKPPKWHWKGILGANVLATVAAGGPFAATQVLAPICVFTILLGLVRNLSVCMRMYRQREQRKVVAMSFLAWGSLLLAAGVDFVPWLQLGEPFGGLRLVPLGMTFYSLFLFLGMGTDYLRTLERTDELNKQLQAQLQEAEKGQAEIQKLNEELRRQVAERSRQLLAALLPVDDSDMGMLKLSPGELIEGRYKIVREIASGGMGQVFQAVRQDDGRVLAIKVSLELDTSARARIVREAQVASRIVHPNLVSVIDVGVASTGYVYLVMEYVDGTTLSRWHQQFGNVEWGLTVLTQICQALTALHTSGLVHRDLKPGNIFVTAHPQNPTRPPTIKLGDFGISKAHHQRRIGSLSPPKHTDMESFPPAERTLVDKIPLNERHESTVAMKAAMRRGGPTKKKGKPAPADVLPNIEDILPGDIPDLTAAGVVLGTPMYVAPELASPWAEVTPAADMYSFGVLVFNVLGRSTPFQQPLFYISRAGQSYPPACSITTVCPNLPDFLSQAIDSCLSVEPGKRPSARRMGELIDRTLEQISTKRDSALS
jgi:serine/threonine-protein kinase